MREQLLAYLLNDLSAEKRHWVEEQLRQDPQWQQELQRLQDCLSSSDNEGTDGAEPPGDLTARTCCVVQNADSIGIADGQATVAIAPNAVDTCRRHRWSFVDFVVAFGVLATIGMLLLPAVNRARETSRRLACQNNLKQIGKALVHYAEQHREGLPRVNFDEPAGIFVLKLVDSGMIDRAEMARLRFCPSSPSANQQFTNSVFYRVPSRTQFEAATGRLLTEMRRHLGGSYAYRLGYFDSGNYRYVKFLGRSDAPMLADAPRNQTGNHQHENGLPIPRQHVAYHGGCGQNVLYQDQSVRFCTNCVDIDTGDDLYRNSAGQQAAGKHPRDVVLGSSETRPDGLTEVYWP